MRTDSSTQVRRRASLLSLAWVPLYRSGSGLPGKFVVLIMGLSILVSTWLLLLGPFRLGVSVDEPLHMDMFRRFGGTFEANLYYGEVSWIYSHLFNVLLGLESFGQPTDDAASYLGRHLAIAILSLAGAGAAFGIVHLITRSMFWSILAVTALLATPVWLGHSMFNPKDVPVAVGFLFFSLGLLGVVQLSLREQRVRPWELVLPQLSILTGTFLVVGTRLGMIAPLGLMTFGVLFLAAKFGRHDRLARHKIWLQFLTSALAHFVALAVVIGLLFYLNPEYYSELFQRLTEVASVTVGNYWGGTVMVLGNEVAVPPPWWYVPAFLLFQMPLFAILPLVGSGVAVIIHLSRLVGTKPVRRHSPRSSERWIFRTGLLLLLIQSFATPAAIAIVGMTIFDATRHVLFIIPSLVLLAVLALRGFASESRVAHRLAVTAFLVGLIPAQVSNVTLFPYNYVYFNPLALFQQVDESWETDYWHLSYREALTHIPAQATVICGFWPDGPLESSEVPAPCRELQPYVPKEQWFADSTTTEVWLVMSQRYFVADRGNLGQCRPQGQVTRSLFGQELVLSAVFTCPVTS